ncbi:MAG TPA: alpha/beta fold hydrolase [Opitutaceae bacterium]
MKRWLVYLALLGLSWLVRREWTWEPAPQVGQEIVWLEAFSADGPAPRAGKVRVAVRVLTPPGRPEAPTVVLLHGSPVVSVALAPLVERLRGDFRLVVPDLPGFGRSSLRVPDYSLHAQARYVRALLDRLGVARAHVVGYSMGGGVALALADAAPERVKSLTLVSSIGLQEQELLGDYDLNHALHGLQLALLWGLQELTPHFGLLDWFPVNTSYARNFYDSDQRPLRAALEHWAGPMLIVHGDADALVPVSAAREHARLVPQSELRLLPGGHDLVFAREGVETVAAPVRAFLQAAELGRSVTRSNAEPGRVAAARPDARPEPMLAGTRLVWVLALLALATLASEDLACVAAGLLVAKGSLGFLPATAACFAGLLAGDLLLVLLGRTVGRRSLRAWPLRWIVSPEAVERAERWFAERGARLIFLSRFMPGTRLPTYVAAGVLRAPLGRFVAWFALACAVWTPLLVGLSVASGGVIWAWWHRYEDAAVWLLLALIAGVWGGGALLRALATWRGRRRLLGRWRRLTRWEFWPMWAVYPPVVAYIVAHGLRTRCLTWFTAVNPGIGAGGGLVGESKSEILHGLNPSGVVAAWTRLAPGAPAERVAAVRRFMDEQRLDYPIVLKPDVGERGTGVVIARTAEAVEAALRAEAQAVIVQAYVPGVEFGVFYHRRPAAARGDILAVTDKRMVAVTGDGVRTLEELVLGDERAVCMAPFFLRTFAHRLDHVPAAGESEPLTELGTHCRGAVFLDGTSLVTPRLIAEVERVSRVFEGFYFGRYDVRAESVAAFQRGEFKVIELNGLTSEATSIYDPRHSLWFGWRLLLRQWRIAAQIAAENRARGVRVLTARETLALWRHARPQPPGPEPAPRDVARVTA